MTAVVLADALGPRGRRRVRVATVFATAVVVVLAVIAVGRLRDRGQLTAAKWSAFTDPAVLRFLGRGLLSTLSAALTAMAVAIPVGLAAALGRLARNPVVRRVAGLYVEAFRALPLLLLILFSFFVLDRYGLNLSRFWYLVLALVAYNGAVLGEIFRAGILSLDRGQTEAAYAIGLSYWETMLTVVLPQAVRRMVPAIVSQLVTLLKDTALGSVIGFEELLRRAQIVGELPGKPILQALIVAAAVYVAVNFALSTVARRLEIRQQRRHRAAGTTVTVTGLEDLTAVQAAATAVTAKQGPGGL